MKRLTKIIVISLVIIGIAVFAWLAYQTANKVPSTASQPTATTKNKSSAKPADTLLALINAERKKAGVKELKIDDRLNQSAQWKVDDMVKNNYTGYVKPGDKTPNGLNKLFELTGKDCSFGNEIMVWDSDKRTITPEIAADYWIKSASNHKTIVDPDYVSTGFGIGQYAIVEHFCQP